MATLVGTQKDFYDALASLVELDYAAVASYEEAIEHVQNDEHRTALKGFKEDHSRHIKELSSVLSSAGKTPPTSAGIKQLFTQGKVMFANLGGDKAILMALKSNEEDTNTGYDRVNEHEDKTEEAVEPLMRGLKDERKHREWLRKAIEEMK